MYGASELLRAFVCLAFENGTICEVLTLRIGLSGNWSSAYLKVPYFMALVHVLAKISQWVRGGRIHRSFQNFLAATPVCRKYRPVKSVIRIWVNDLLLIPLISLPPLFLETVLSYPGSCWILQNFWKNLRCWGRERKLSTLQFLLALGLSVSWPCLLPHQSSSRAQNFSSSLWHPLIIRFCKP